jgi:hypothetical protein
VVLDLHEQKNQVQMAAEKLRSTAKLEDLRDIAGS